MLICHKLVAWNGAAVLQARHMSESDMHATLAVSIMTASWEVVCRWAPQPVLYITSGFSINTTTRHRRITTIAVAWGSCRTHENSMHAEQIIIMFYIFILFFALWIWYYFQLYYTEQQLLFTLTIFFYINIYSKCIK